MSVDPVAHDEAEYIEMDTIETDQDILDTTDEAQIIVDEPGTSNLPEVLDTLDLPDAPDFFDSPAKQEKVKSFYKHLLDNGYPIDKNALIEHKAYFKINADKELFIKYNKKTIKLTWEGYPDKFLSPSTIASNYNRAYPEKGGANFVRNVFGIGDKQKISQSVEYRAIRFKQSIPQDYKIDNSTLEEAISYIDQIHNTYADLKAEINAVSEKKTKRYRC